MVRRVTVLCNEPSPFADLAESGVVDEATDVAEALQEVGVGAEVVRVCGLTLPETMAELRSTRERVTVFNLCEGLDGRSEHEPLVAELLELCGLKFTGNGPRTLAWAVDKGVAKARLRLFGIPTPPGAVFTHVPEVRTLREVRYPCIVKPVREDGSVGIDGGAVVWSAEDAQARIGEVLQRFSQPALVERYLPGREFKICLLPPGPRVLPVEEIEFVGYQSSEPRLVSYDAKWRPGSRDDLGTVPVCPARIPHQLHRALEDLALRTYEAFECRGYTAVDVRLDEAGMPHVLDVNPNPDLSRTAGFALCAQTGGFSYPDMIRTIAEEAWNGSSSMT